MSADLTDKQREDLIISEAHRQDQLRAVAVAKVRQMIMRHIPYPPFRDEALMALDEMLKVFGYFK